MRALAAKISLVPAVYWLLLTVSRGVDFWSARTMAAPLDDYTAGSPLERLVYSLLIAAALWILWRRRERTAPLLRRNAVLLLLFAFMAASTLWSPFPAVSLKRFIKTCGTLALMATLLTEDDPEAAIVSALEAFLTLALGLSLLFAVALPSRGVSSLEGSPAWVGITFTKNNMGQLAGLGALFFLWRLRQPDPPLRRAFALAWLAASLLMLVKARSTTSLGMFVGGSGLLGFLVFFKNSPLAAKASMIACAAAALAAVPLFGDLVVRENALVYVVSQTGKNMTFTGRTDLWADVWRLAQSRLLLGHGYGGFWIGDLGNDLWGKYVWHPNQAHNGYLDVVAQIGLAGAAITALAIAHAWRTSLRRLRTGGAFGVLAMVVVAAILFNNMFESSLIRLNHLYWTVFLLFAMEPGVDAARRAETAGPAGPAGPAEAEGGSRP